MASMFLDVYISARRGGQPTDAQLMINQAVAGVTINISKSQGLPLFREFPGGLQARKISNHPLTGKCNAGQEK